jgi:four helix bundle protein
LATGKGRLNRRASMTIDLLPKFEMYEEGSQIRRSSKSIRSNIVEGYGRRRYKQDFIRFLTYAHASCDETIDHLETLQETGSLKDESLFKQLHDQLDRLGGTLNHFIQIVESQHQSVREEGAQYTVLEETE